MFRVGTIGIRLEPHGRLVHIMLFDIISDLCVYPYAAALNVGFTVDQGHDADLARLTYSCARRQICGTLGRSGSA